MDVLMATRFVIGSVVKRIPSRVEAVGGAVVIRTLCQLVSNRSISHSPHAQVETRGEVSDTSTAHEIKDVDLPRTDCTTQCHI